MKVEQIIWTPKYNWEMVYDQGLTEKAQLVLAFGYRNLLEDETLFSELSSLYPNAELVVCSTSGEILQDEILHESIAVTALYFEKTEVKVADINLDGANTETSVSKLVGKISTPYLSHVLLFADGLVINGAELTESLKRSLTNVPVIGGLASDGFNTLKTVVGLNEKPVSGKAIAVAFYGNNLKISSNVGLGWNTFGIKRKVTKSTRNIVYEIEGKNALDLYRSYLGDLSKELPTSAMLIPVGLLNNETYDITIKSVIDIDHRNNGLVFSSNIKEGSVIYFMKSTNESLVQRAQMAARQGIAQHRDKVPDFALVVSSLGRLLTMRQWAEDELEAINDEFQEAIPISGFYGLGEIAPHRKHKIGTLHNHSISVSLFSE